MKQEYNFSMNWFTYLAEKYPNRVYVYEDKTGRTKIVVEEKENENIQTS